MPSKTTAKKKNSSAKARDRRQAGHPSPRASRATRGAPQAEAPRPQTVEERTAYLEGRLQGASPEVQQRYRDDLDVSWIAHDSALEGVVYTMQELRTAIDPSASFVGDSSLQPVVEEIRRHREALNYVREMAVKRRQPITLDLLKRIYLTLHPEEGDVKTVKYRKDIPQHRLYFHEYAPPDKITYKMRQIIDWVNDPETRRTRTTVRLAARAHYDILRVFPFPVDSGKVARLFMNLLLLRGGYPPAIVHSTERQRYYEALKGSSAMMNTIVQDAIENSLASIEKLLDFYEGKKHAM
jgi:Fic family protein